MQKMLADVTQASLPLYVQISEALTREMAAGHWKAGDRLPPEAQLAQSLGVAVGTLRKALAELEQRGLLERRQGSGTYVQPDAQSHSATIGNSVYDFFRLELVRGAGLPTAAVIDFQKIKRPSHVPVLGTQGDATCYRLRRLRSLNAVPVAVEEIYFDAGPQVNAQTNLTLDDLGEALYLFYRQKLGFWITRAEDSLGMGAVPAWAPSLFKPAAASPCAQIERRAWSMTGCLQEYSLTWFDTARCRYVNRLR
jgi:GntR family transcriptional regulator